MARTCLFFSFVINKSSHQYKHPSSFKAENGIVKHFGLPSNAGSGKCDHNEMNDLTIKNV